MSYEIKLFEMQAFLSLKSRRVQGVRSLSGPYRLLFSNFDGANKEGKLQLLMAYTTLKTRISN